MMFRVYYFVRNYEHVSLGPTVNERVRLLFEQLSQILGYILRIIAPRKYFISEGRWMLLK